VVFAEAGDLDVAYQHQLVVVCLERRGEYLAIRISRTDAAMRGRSTVCSTGTPPWRPFTSRAAR